MPERVPGFGQLDVARVDIVMAPRVLVTDAEERSVLAAVRGLGRAGYGVSAAASRHPAAGHWSRSCSERLFLPDPRRDATGFVSRLEEVVSGNEYAVLLPGLEASMLPISAHRERLERSTRLGLPPHEVVRHSIDKVLLLKVAAAVGLSPPPSITCSDWNEGAAAARELGFPVVVKPAQSYVSSDGALKQKTAKIVADERSLLGVLGEFGTPFILQRFERDSSLVSCCGVVGDRLLAFAVARYQRTWPPEAGSASFAETVVEPPGLAAKIEALLAAIGWQGIFEIEVLTSGDGRLAVIDFNPRVFGWLALAIEAGANLPAIWCDWLLGRSPRFALARPGVHYRWEDAELRHFLWQLHRGRFRAAAAVLQPHRHVVHAHFRLTDPAPLAARCLYIARRAIG